MSDDEFTANKEDVLSIIGTGMHVFAFTINYERRLKKLVELGISGCFSDFLSPDVLKKYKNTDI
jgi:glycerophosphoryl diester phosphodiesterase